MKGKKKHLNIVMFKQKPKTKVFKVFSNHDGSDLGFVYWSGRWRQYVYDPDMNSIIWSHDCLTELADFIRDLNYIQRIKKHEPQN